MLSSIEGHCTVGSSDCLTPRMKLSRVHGQALVFFVVTVLACLLVGIGVFNVGQTVSEKMRVTNTADAAAYSGAVWEARTLNFQAYVNRAMVANEVAIGQAVSIVSWVSYVQSVSQNLNNYLFWVPYLGGVLAKINDVLIKIVDALDVYVPIFIQGVDFLVNQILAPSQGVAHAAAIAAVPGVVSEVVKANDPDSYVTNLSQGFMVAHLIKWNGLTKTYSGMDRERFKQVTMDSRDGFTRERNWKLTLPWIPVDAPGDQIFPVFITSAKKRGGTDLVGLDEWRGVDTLGDHYGYWGKCSAGKISLPCWKSDYEARFGYGAAQVFDSQAGASGDTGFHGNAPGENPRTYSQAMDGIDNLTEKGVGNVYSGLPKYRDIADLTDKNPTLRLPVEVAKGSASARTSGNAGIGASRLQLNDCYAGKEISKLAEAEVYFKHPDTYAGYGSQFSRPEEIGSLFNPYWQARLIQPSATEKSLARLTKGKC